MPSLNTAVAGLMMHQQKMDMIADNIANVNTVGFKGSRAEFADSFYQTIRAANNRVPVGIAVGTGGNLNTMATIDRQGAISRTGGTFDVAISGNGFFVVRDAVKDAIYFTRAGDFSVDKTGKLINSLGYNVLGVLGDRFATDGDAEDPGLNAPTAVDDLIVPPDFVSQAAEVQATGTITVGSDLPDAGETLVIGGVTLTFVAGVAGANQISIGADAAATADNIVAAIEANATLDALISADSSSNVVSLVTTSSGFGAGALGNNVGIGTGNATGTITVSGLPAAGETLTIGGIPFTFVATASSDTNIQIGTTVAETIANIVTALNLTANKTQTEVTAFANTASTILLTAIEGGTSGNAISLAEAATNIAVSGATLSGGVVAASTSEIAFPPGSNNLLVGGSDVGEILTETVMNVAISLDGKINLFGSGGTTRTIGILMMAKFFNNQALTKVGQNLYQFNEAAGNKSGTSSFSITSDVRSAGTDGIGQLQSGALELSNVDISEQFTDMILTQRGFEANARVITTTDEMLQTVVNLRR